MLLSSHPDVSEGGHQTTLPLPHSQWGLRVKKLAFKVILQVRKDGEPQISAI